MISPADFVILKGQEISQLKKEYQERFHQEFVTFNYADFMPKDGKPSIQIYKETLQECLKKNKPYNTPTKYHPEKRWEDFFKSRGQKLDEEDKK